LCLYYVQKMDNDFQWDSEERLDELRNKFEAMLNGNESFYFDTEEYEILIDYYQETFNDEKAQLAIDHACITHPGNSRVKIRIARQLATKGNFEKAINLLDEIERTEAAEMDIDIIMTRGFVLSLMMEHQKAAIEFEKALAIAEADELEEIYTAIALEYENISAYEKAMDYLLKALAISNDPEDIIFEIAICYELADQIEDSISFLSQYADNNPYSMAAWYNLGLSYYQLELYEKAIDAYEFAIAIDHSYLPAITSLANTYYNMGEYSKAIELYKESLEMDESDAHTICLIGECYEKQGDYTEALQYFNRALEIDETHSEAWAAIAVIFSQEGNYHTALSLIDKAIELDTINTEFLKVQAEIYVHLEYFERAKESYKFIETINPIDPDLWKDYAMMYVRMGETVKAIQVLKTGLIHLPADTQLMYRLAGILILNNSMKQALYYLETALSIDYDGHIDLISLIPDLLNYPAIVELIELYSQKS